MMSKQQVQIHDIVRILKKQIRQWKTPAVGLVAEETRDPYQILISCILSLRTKDETTDRASQSLFRHAATPQAMLCLKTYEIEKLIYPVGFYKTKACTIRDISQVLVSQYDSKVPDTLEQLLELKGVGRKTANLVLTLGFDKDGICVDTHVHRISNRLGWVKTKTPEQTEYALMKVLSRSYWKIINDLLVTFGQNCCKPLSPICSACPISSYCPKIGVARCR
ncbi:MAG: endonuclease III [Chlamydiota bacterium]|nr:endonuclease III [Chlamydiota bacterium]